MLWSSESEATRTRDYGAMEKETAAVSEVGGSLRDSHD